MQRIHSLDLARGFTVLFIPAIHSVMVFGQPEVRTSLFGYFLTAIAEGPGAQVFMTIMGIVFTFREKHSFSSICLRAGMLLLAGYLLNIAKFVMPYSVNALPIEVLNELEIDQTKNILWQLSGIGDILHFAAIALIIIALVYRSRNFPFISAALITLIIFISPLVWDVKIGNFLSDYAIRLFTGQPPRVFFPVFPWLAYPLWGLIIGYYIKRRNVGLIKRALWAAIVCLTAGIIVYIILDKENKLGFYRTYAGESLLHISIVIYWLIAWQWLITKVKDNAFFALLRFCSREITMIYIIQWVVIFWCLTITDYQTLNLLQSLIIAINMTGISIGLTALFTLNRKANGHQ